MCQLSARYCFGRSSLFAPDGSRCLAICMMVVKLEAGLSFRRTGFTVHGLAHSNALLHRPSLFHIEIAVRSCFCFNFAATVADFSEEARHLVRVRSS